MDPLIVTQRSSDPLTTKCAISAPCLRARLGGCRLGVTPGVTANKKATSTGGHPFAAAAPLAILAAIRWASSWVRSLAAARCPTPTCGDVERFVDMTFMVFQICSLGDFVLWARSLF
jgi:hypothetical protein